MSPSQFDALQAIQSHQNIFITGAAGTGKSFLIQQYIANLDRKVWPVLASTGAAAIRINGRTFHSFFGLGIMEGGYEATIEKALKDKRVARRLKKAKGIVIDEISMIPAPALRAAEEISRWARDSDLPWGGLQVISVGDFFQLPPVTLHGQRRDWAFLDPVWRNSEFRPVVLKEIIRSKDDEFLDVLGDIRLGEVTSRVKSFLDSKIMDPDDQVVGTRLFGRRVHTEKYNLSELSKLMGEAVVYETEYTGRDYGVRSLKKQAPVPEKLVLKRDAFVMIRQNDPQGRWVNGTLGNVRGLEKDKILIETLAGADIEIKKSSFDLLDADSKVIASCSNFPVNLAYATTIHKAQGATLDAAVIDLENLWEPGQAYVALSRLRSGEGLYVTGWSELSIHIDPQVRTFYESLENPETFEI